MKEEETRVSHQLCLLLSQSELYLADVADVVDVAVEPGWEECRRSPGEPGLVGPRRRVGGVAGRDTRGGSGPEAARPRIPRPESLARPDTPAPTPPLLPRRPRADRAPPPGTPCPRPGRVVVDPLRARQTPSAPAAPPPATGRRQARSPARRPRRPSAARPRRPPA